MDEGRGIDGRQKVIKEIERESSGVLSNAGLLLRSGNHCTDRDNNRGCRSDNNWVRRVEGMKRVDRKKLEVLREEIHVQECFMGRLTKSRLKRACHQVYMREERMAKRVDRLREQCWKKKGTPQLRWEDCVRRDINKVGVIGQ